MSNRRNARRRVAAMVTHYSADSNSGSEDENMEDVLLTFMRAAFTASKRRRSTKKCKCSNCKCTKKTSPKKTTKPKKAAQKPASKRGGPSRKASTQVVSLESDSCDSVVNSTVIENHQKSVEKKVDSFFKSHNLLSDDEDDDIPLEKSEPVQKAKSVCKDFYLLSDSDEEMPSTSVSKTVSYTSTSTSTSTTTSFSQSKISEGKDEDNLMEMVDKILDDEVPVETKPEKDNWMDFKRNTEELLGSVNAILGSFTEKPKEKTDVKADKKETSPIKSKPSCPICLEVMDGDIVPRVTICGHIFCKDCILQVAKTSKSCPTCRKRVTTKQIHPIYL